MQVCSPAAKDMCGRRFREMSNSSECSHRASSRFADPMHTSITAPAGKGHTFEFGFLGHVPLHRGQRCLEAAAPPRWRVRSARDRPGRPRNCSGWLSNRNSRFPDDR